MIEMSLTPATRKSADTFDMPTSSMQLGRPSPPDAG
jgi:hypothetical protein